MRRTITALLAAAALVLVALRGRGRTPFRAAVGIAAVDVDDDGIDELFLTLEDGQVWGMKASGALLPGFPLHTGARAHTVPLLEDLDGDGDLELVLGAEDGMLRVWDLPYRKGPRPATWPGLQGGAGLPGTPGGTSR